MLPQDSKSTLLQWTAIDLPTGIRFLSFSHRKDWFFSKAHPQLITWWITSFGLNHPIDVRTDDEGECATSSLGFFKRNLENPFNHLGVERSIIREGHPEDNYFVDGFRQTDDQELYILYLALIKTGKVFAKTGIWRQKIYNLDHPRQRLGDLTPYEELKSSGH